ncbi:hypothetical protein Ato02nite_067180 [Paractinoplanes toevensis]|uniref:Uncharacterized protein n=2 Tax=Paractinoplanes toevensis TaxID=571911 RepID=A0A919W6M4_9ACTN|nr:hypothetical protein Ato02nite_067180 [Actinoplanes toevensis]
MTRPGCNGRGAVRRVGGECVTTQRAGLGIGDLTWLDRKRKLGWAADLREALTRPGGYAADNTAWGGNWAITLPAAGTAPVPARRRRN